MGDLGYFFSEFRVVSVLINGNDLISKRFQLGGLLGSGASSSVYSATDMTTGAIIALKILHPKFSKTAALRTAFLDEARVTLGVRHPNLSAVLDFGIHDPEGQNRAWIAMEFAPGLSLAEFVETQGVQSPTEALGIADGVLAALSAIHDAGLVHRDVTPNNIMVEAGPAGLLTASGVRLIDFGLVDTTGMTATGWHVLRTAEDPTQVQATGVIGSVNYISPEQARGDTVDARGDLYQVGCVLYFALTGEPPFPACTPEETLQAHAVLPPPVPSVIRPGVSPAIDRIVVRAMLKAPGSRFATVAEFRTAIQAAQVALSRSDETTVEVEDAGLTRVLARTTLAAASDRTAVITPASPKETYTGQASRGRSRSTRSFWLVLVPVLLVAAVIVSVVSANSAAPDAPAAIVVSTSAPSSSPTPTPSITAVPVMLTVPQLTGSQVVAARDILAKMGLTVAEGIVEDSVLAADTVISLSPAAGESVAKGTAIMLTVASGSNKVPAVMGATQAEAIRLLQAAGFTVVVTTGNSPRTQETAPGLVSESQPSAGASLRLGASVTVVMAPALTPTLSPTPSPTPASTTSPPPSTSTPLPAAR